MSVGIMFMLVGILIAAFPALLRLIVSVFLILIGVTFVSMSYHYKKIKRESDNPFVDFFIKF